MTTGPNMTMPDLSDLATRTGPTRAIRDQPVAGDLTGTRPRNRDYQPRHARPGLLSRRGRTTSGQPLHGWRGRLAAVAAGVFVMSATLAYFGVWP